MRFISLIPLLAWSTQGLAGPIPGAEANVDTVVSTDHADNLLESRASYQFSLPELLAFTDHVSATRKTIEQVMTELIWDYSRLQTSGQLGSTARIGQAIEQTSTDWVTLNRHLAETHELLRQLAESF